MLYLTRILRAWIREIFFLLIRMFGMSYYIHNLLYPKTHSVDCITAFLFLSRILPQKELIKEQKRSLDTYIFDNLHERNNILK